MSFHGHQMSPRPEGRIFGDSQVFKKKGIFGARLKVGPHRKQGHFLPHSVRITRKQEKKERLGTGGGGFCIQIYLYIKTIFWSMLT